MYFHETGVFREVVVAEKKGNFLFTLNLFVTTSLLPGDTPYSPSFSCHHLCLLYKVSRSSGQTDLPPRWCPVFPFVLSFGPTLSVTPRFNFIRSVTGCHGSSCTL